MKSKTLILMFIAIGCGLAASYMTSRVIADRNQVPEEEKVTVLVARQNLPMGTYIKEPEKLFEEKQFVKGSEPKKAIAAFDQLKDKRLNKPLGAEQFITPDDLLDKDNGSLSAVMRPGMRAVALKVNPEACVGGFVLPNSRVDIISVVHPNDRETMSKIILQNVLVLAVDQAAVRPDDKQAVLSSTVTVEVTPAEAEKLNLATDLGTIRLVLRSFGDEEKVTTAGVTSKGLLQGNGSKSDDTIAVAEVESSKSRAPLLGPKVPELPAPTEGAKVEAKATTPPLPKTHTLTIFNGEAVTRAVFVEGDTSTRIETTEPVAKAQRPAPAKP